MARELHGDKQAAPQSLDRKLEARGEAPPPPPPTPTPTPRHPPQPPRHLHGKTLEQRDKTLRLPPACFLTGAGAEEAITPQRRQIGRGSYLGCIRFDILHRYILTLTPPPLPLPLLHLVLRSHIFPLADVPLKRNEFFMSLPRPLPPSPTFQHHSSSSC